MTTINVRVAPNGAITIEARGFAGRSCLDATRSLEAALGVVGADCLTNDFFMPTRVEEPLLARGDAD